MDRPDSDSPSFYRPVDPGDFQEASTADPSRPHAQSASEDSQAQARHRTRGEDRDRDDVRPGAPPPVAGPNYRTLLVAVALLVALIGVSLFLLPGSRPAPEQRIAPTLPEQTYLDLPPIPEAPEIPEPPPARWLDDPAAPPPSYEDPEVWDEAGATEEAAPEVDPREASFRAALRSAQLRQAGEPEEDSAEADLLRETTSLLPSPEELRASLASLGRNQAPAFSEGLSAGGGDTPLDSVPGADFASAAYYGTADLPGSALGSGPALRAGSLIPARLETALDSDSPGPVLARVTWAVVDPATGRVLIPAGARLLGSVHNQLAYGENRVLLAFDRLTWPGASYRLPGLDALETAGPRGLGGSVDRHLWPTLGRAGLLALIGSGVQLSQPQQGAFLGLQAEQIVAGELGLELGRVASRILSRSLDRRPTVRVPAGESFFVYVPQDLRLSEVLP